MVQQQTQRTGLVVPMIEVMGKHLMGHGRRIQNDQHDGQRSLSQPYHALMLSPLRA